jgi:penicillin-binding protein 1C
VKINQQFVFLKSLLTKLLKRRFIRFLLGVLSVLLVLNFVFPPKTEISYSTLITDSEGKVIHAFLSNDDKWRMFVELNEITPMLRKAILQKEDRYFYYHFGVNPLAIIRAIFRNSTSGRRTSGASTITMQVVRLLYPNERTYWNKTTEILRAMQLELRYSKDEILQMYLNLVPFGSNIEGIKSASYLYFQKSPDRLSLAEVMTLSIIPNRPTSLRLGSRNPIIVEERNKWLERFKKEAVFETQLIEDAIREPLHAVRHEAPKNAPHLSFRLKKAYPSQFIIHSTIKPAIQSKTEALVFNYVNRLKAMNIQNAAVLIINNQTMQVEAYIGSADFKNTVDGGQVDGIQAVRSPGSALKPLLYATAFDKGIITPKNMVNDVPTNFNGFEPENFDKKFNGKVSVEFALANSLNIPAVKILKDLGKKELIEQLKKADFQTVKKQENDLGLSIVLGGCGVTLEEMTRLYAAFANGGDFGDLRFTNEDLRIKKISEFNRKAERRPSSIVNRKSNILSSESAYLITEILAQIKRPDLPNNFDYSYRLPKIAWKTGTSFGRRDAWSIGYNKKYTVGVWVGNFSGEGVPELSGAEMATPLLFQIFNSIDYNSSVNWFAQPKGIKQRQVCAESGDLASEFCSNKILDYNITGVSHARKCTHLKKVFVSLSESMSYCTSCLPVDGYKEKLYSNHSAELIAFYDSKQIVYDRIPKHNPNCTRVFKQVSEAPNIVSPHDGSEYFIDKSEPQQLQLKAQTASDVKEVYWYVENQLIAKSDANKPVFFSPKAGRLKISCTDDKGRNADIWISVKY